MTPYFVPLLRSVILTSIVFLLLEAAGLVLDVEDLEELAAVCVVEDEESAMEIVLKMKGFN